MVHSFTCAGILPSQYIHFSKFAGIGVVGHGYIKHGMFLSFFCLCVFIIIFVFAVYNTGYIENVDKLAEVSMVEAIAEIKTYSRYMADGEVCA